MSKLTNQDIQRIIRQWLKEKTVADIARGFQVTQERVHQLFTLFKEIEEYPELNQQKTKGVHGSKWDQTHRCYRETPQTNGKIERFFGDVERRIGKFRSIDNTIHCYNVIRPHMSLDYDEPCNVFWFRLPCERILS